MGIPTISQFLEGILKEHLESACSLESRLFFISICSIRIPSRNRDIFEKPLIVQDQLQSRMRYIYTSSDDEIDSIEDVDRVPNLNPHAASFIPFSIQTPTGNTRVIALF